MTARRSEPVLRITPMMVLPDIGTAMRRYEMLGFERVESGAAGCIGMRAGPTAVILASADFMNGDFNALNTARILGQTIKYVHVRSVDDARTRLPGSARALQDVRTRAGTRELLVEDDGDLLIFAEKVR